jgi:hypothetical protein
MSYNLLSVGADAKTIKGNGDEYITAIQYMASYKTVWEGKVHNLCAMAEKAKCHEGCLVTAGRGQMSSVQAGRLRKALMYIKDRGSYLNVLRSDLTTFVRRADKNGQQPCVRPNGTTDIMFENYGIIEEYPTVQWYDYTKIVKRAYAKLPSNYHLTLSYSEADPAYAASVIKASQDTGTNMAVVFRDKNNIPSTFAGMPVINGDKDDLRFLDPKGSVVALYAKGRAVHDTTGFVINN